MTDVTQGADYAPPDVVFERPAGTPDAMSAREAGRVLASLRKPKDTPAPEPAAEAAPAAEESTAQAEDAAPPTEATGETQEAAPVVEEQPSIEPPRSWSKDARERWSKLDPDTQNYLLERDRDDTAAVRKAQNEAAEQRKAVEAERLQAEQARQKFEAALPQVMALLQHQASTEFADIQTEADVDRLSREDWPRYIQWQRYREKTTAVLNQMQTAQQQKQTEEQRKFTEFSKEQDKLFVEKVPDMADEKKAGELQKAAMASLKAAGFAEDELAGAWQGIVNVPFRDHRVQLMIHKAALWDKAQAQVKTITANAKPIPPVQRPGAAQPKGAAQAAQVTNLENRLKNARGNNAARIGAELLRARRAAR